MMSQNSITVNIAPFQFVLVEGTANKVLIQVVLLFCSCELVEMEEC